MHRPSDNRPPTSGNFTDGQQTRIMLFTDEPPLALGAACLLSTVSSMTLIQGPNKIVDLVPAVKRERPDVLLLDLNPEVTLALISVLRDAAPGCRLVLWVGAISGEFTQQARDNGIAGIVSRKCTNSEFVEQLLDILQGSFIFEPDAPSTGTTRVNLSRRESQIVALLAQGLRNKEIAACLGITEGTVKGYLVHLFQKVGAKDRFELAVLGLKNTSCGQATWDGAGGFVTDRQEERARPVLRSLVLVEPARRSGYPETARRVAVGE